MQQGNVAAPAASGFMASMRRHGGKLAASGFMASMRRHGGKLAVVGTAATVFGGSALAAADVSAAVTAFGDVEAAVNSVGPLMITAVVAGIVYKWVVAFFI